MAYYEFNKDKFIDVTDYKESIMMVNKYIPVYLDDNAVKSLDFDFACICLDNNKDIPYIIVDNQFLKLSKKTQEFILQHEVGHYIKGHFTKHYTIKESIIRFIRTHFTDKLDPEEQEADLYAYEKIGSIKVLDCLEESYNLSINELKEQGEFKKALKVSKELRRRRKLLSDKIISMYRQQN